MNLLMWLPSAVAVMPESFNVPGFPSMHVRPGLVSAIHNGILEVKDPMSEAAAVTIDVIQFAIAMVVGALAGLAVGVVILGIGRVLTHRYSSFKPFAQKFYRPLQVLLVLVGVWIGFGVAQDQAFTGTVEKSNVNVPTWIGYANHVFVILFILACSWLVVGILNGVTAVIHERIRESSERRAKRVQTQMQILHRVIVVIVWILGFAGVLLTFPAARTAGASLFASAGVLSVVAGLAAQTTLGNVFAGLQLAFSDSIRVGDIVFYQNNYTTVEEITLTYVVLAVWDGRRIIVPSSLLTTESFENWTRRAPEMVGTVELDVDWAVPVAAARKALKAILLNTDLWDGKTGVLQVSDAVGSIVRIKIVVSAKNSPTLTDLRNYVREQMVVWIQHEAPQAIPHNYNWDYEQPSFAQAEQASLECAEKHLAQVQPTSYLPEHATQTSADVESGTDPHPSAVTTEVLSAPEIAGLKENTQPVNPDEREAEAGLAALAAGANPAQMRQWQPSTGEEAPNSDRADEGLSTGNSAGEEPSAGKEGASTMVMKITDVRKITENESALFSGSAEGEERSKNFAGPDEEVYAERKKKLERSTGVIEGV